MAALYLHNAIFEPDRSPSDGLSSSNRPISVGTLRTAESHTTEPLLQDTQSLAFQELLSLQPSHPGGPESGWNIRLSLDGLPRSHEERVDAEQRSLRLRLRRTKSVIIALQIIIGMFF